MADAMALAVELDAPTADAEVDVEDAVELEVVVLEVLEEDVVEVVESVVEVGVADVAGAALVAGSVHQHRGMTREIIRHTHGMAKPRSRSAMPGQAQTSKLAQHSWSSQQRARPASTLGSCSSGCCRKRSRTWHSRCLQRNPAAC